MIEFGLMLAVAVCPAPVREVAVGDPLRTVLLDTLRPEIAEDLGQPVKFVVRRLRTCGDWAFALVEPQTPAGGAIDFSATRHAERIEQGAFDGASTYALIGRRGGAWRVRSFAIGPTDVVWLGWVDEFGAPEALFAEE